MATKGRTNTKICPAGLNWLDGKIIGGQKVYRGKDKKWNNWSARAGQLASRYCKDPSWGRKSKNKK